MIPVDQTVFGAPGGNCFSACVASLLEIGLDEVPYFMGEDGKNDLWFSDFLVWLRPYGYTSVCFDVSGVQGWRPEDGLLCILAGKSPRPAVSACASPRSFARLPTFWTGRRTSGRGPCDRGNIDGLLA